MTQTSTVVGENKRLPKQQLHAEIMKGWARGIAAHGKGGWADRLEISTQALDKQLVGGMPGMEVIDRAIDAQDDVLSDYLATKGKRLVDEDITLSMDRAMVQLCRLMTMIAEAEHPDSPGGRAIVPQELVCMEEAIRAVHAKTGRMLAQIGDIRSPSLKAVA